MFTRWMMMLGASVIALFVTSFVLAEEVPMSAATVAKIMQLVNQEDYVGVRKIKLKDDHYFVEAFTEQGQHIKIYIDPQTFKILDPKPEINRLLTMNDVAKQVEAAGFPEIYIIELQEEGYNVIASNSKRSRVKLFVNASTGKVTDSIFNYLK